MAARRQALRQPPDDAYEQYREYGAYGEYEEYEEYEEEPTPRGQQGQQGRKRSGRAQPRGPALSSRYPASRNAPPRGGPGYYYEPRRDAFPYILGALIGAMIVGIAAVSFLLGSTGKSSSGQAGGSSNAGGAQGVATLAPSSNSSGGSVGQDPPRITLADFMKLYDDPAKRPLIIDVRPKATYDQEHIKGAVSLPLAEVDSRVAELPKDKLVVAYCQ